MNRLDSGTEIPLEILLLIWDIKQFLTGFYAFFFLQRLFHTL